MGIRFDFTSCCARRILSQASRQRPSGYRQHSQDIFDPVADVAANGSYVYEVCTEPDPSASAMALPSVSDRPQMTAVFVLSTLAACSQPPAAANASAPAPRLMTPDELGALPSRAPDRRIVDGSEASHYGAAPAGGRWSTSASHRWVFLRFSWPGRTRTTCPSRFWRLMSKPQPTRATGCGSS